jgi:hypothetical protein
MHQIYCPPGPSVLHFWPSETLRILEVARACPNRDPRMANGALVRVQGKKIPVAVCWITFLVVPGRGGVPRANKTSTYSSLPPFWYASSPSNLKSLPLSSNKLLQHNKMIIYEDVHCGDEMISDAFDLSVMIGLVPLNQKRSEFID